MHIYLTNFPEKHLKDVTAVLNTTSHTYSILSDQQLWEESAELLFPYALVMIYDTVLGEQSTTLFKRVKLHLPASEVWLVSSSYRPEDVRTALKYGFANYVLWSPDMQDFTEMVQNLASYQNFSSLADSKNIYELSQIASSLMDRQMNVNQLLSALIAPGGSLASSYLSLLLRHRELQDQYFTIALIKPVLPIALYFREDFDSVMHIAIAELRIHLDLLLNVIPHDFQVLHSIQENALVCLFHGADSNYADAMVELLQQLNERLQQYLGLSILAGYSRPYTALNKTSYHFQCISDNMRQGLFQDDICTYQLDYERQYVNNTNDIDEYIAKNLSLAISNNDHDLFFSFISNLSTLLQKQSVAYDFVKSILLQSTNRFARETDFYQLVERDFIEVTFAQAISRIPFFFQLLNLYQLLRELYMQAYRNFFDDDSNRLTRAMQYIKENYHQKITLQLIADYLSLTPNYFCGWFKKKTGKNFFDLVTEYRIGAAKDFLANTDRKICDIAVEVGYPEVVSFNRVFKKEVGMPPSEYRRQHTQQKATRA